MQKIIITLVTFFVAMQLGAATYTILSQNNDTIRLYSNELGESLKSLITKADAEPNERYRLIEKNDEGKTSLIFVEITHVLDKMFVCYETDLINAGLWNVKAYGFDDVYNSVRRENAILLKGELVGMKIEIYQRPLNFKDIVNIDGFEFPSPIKISLYESNIAQGLRNQKMERNKELNLLGLTDDDIAETKDKVNECYIANLLVSGKFNSSEDKTLIKGLCNNEVVMSLTKKYNESQLKYLSNGYNTQLKLYEKY
jgi:hypothetical protein